MTGARMTMIRGALAAALLAAAGCATEYSAVDSDPFPQGAFSFIVIGDTPYSSDDEEMLAAALPLIRNGAFPFVIHIGDTKGGRAPCTTDHDDRFARLLADLQPIPVIYTPGDNEWTDCDRNVEEATGKPYSDLARLQMIRTRFFADPPPTPKAFEFERQAAQVENASWRHHGVRFATLHVVGTANGRDFVTGDPLDEAKAAADARDAANSAWLAHALDLAVSEGAAALVIAMQGDPTDFDGPQPCADVSSRDEACDAFKVLREDLRAAAIAFGRPLLVIHGDTAPFTLDQTFAGAEAPTLWRLNAAGDAGIGVTGVFYGTRDVTVVTIDPVVPATLTARGLVSGKAAHR